MPARPRTNLFASRPRRGAPGVGLGGKDRRPGIGAAVAKRNYSARLECAGMKFHFVCMQGTHLCETHPSPPLRQDLPPLRPMRHRIICSRRQRPSGLHLQLLQENPPRPGLSIDVCTSVPSCSRQFPGRIRPCRLRTL